MTYVTALPAVIGDNWDWQMHGACRGLSADLFFTPDFERGRLKRIREASAKAVCGTCPVVAKCLDWALTVGEPYGVWGGKSPTERAELRHGRSHLALAD